MEFDLTSFLEEPTLGKIENSDMKKHDWIAIAKSYKLTFRASVTKSEIRRLVIEYLVVKKILSFVSNL